MVLCLAFNKSCRFKSAGRKMDEWSDFEFLYANGVHTVMTSDDDIRPFQTCEPHSF